MGKNNTKLLHKNQSRHTDNIAKQSNHGASLKTGLNGRSL